jgi:hypothetical protein
MILAFFMILPAQYLALFNRYFLRDKFEILDDNQAFITTGKQAVIEHRQH